MDYPGTRKGFLGPCQSRTGLLAYTRKNFQFCWISLLSFLQIKNSIGDSKAILGGRQTHRQTKAKSFSFWTKIKVWMMLESYCFVSHFWLNKGKTVVTTTKKKTELWNIQCMCFVVLMISLRNMHVGVVELYFFDYKVPYMIWVDGCLLRWMFVVEVTCFSHEASHCLGVTNTFTIDNT